MPLHAVDKPLGLTSHDVVARARRLLGTRRVGHAGTLDPLATGVLLVMSEESTKLSPYLTGHDKTYLAWVTFGAATPTLDAEGPVVSVADASGVTAARLAPALAAFRGVTTQRPPAYSAVKREGVRSYAAARRGELEEPPARPVAYREVALLALAADRADLPAAFARPDGAPPGRYEAAAAGRSFTLPPDPALAEGLEPPPAARRVTALVRLTVGAGTYVRAFARDLGAALGLPAYLSGLVRTASGAVDLADAAPLEAIADTPPLDPVTALELPTVTLGPAAVADVRHGRRPPLTLPGRAALVDGSGSLVALAEPAADAAGYRLLRVFA
ncbi:MAG TPA: tRNA pseudouridine(55) synthase TruB [Trueperaceae bacterium]|nr:tRNA pseudouridine(55) synthase TruB [Trueperaceae bacterium]